MKSLGNYLSDIKLKMKSGDSMASVQQADLHNLRVSTSLEMEVLTDIRSILLLILRNTNEDSYLEFLSKGEGCFEEDIKALELLKSN